MGNQKMIPVMNEYHNMEAKMLLNAMKRVVRREIRRKMKNPSHCTTPWLPRGNQTETNKYIVLNEVVCGIPSHLSMPLVPVPCEMMYIPRYSGSDWRPNTFLASSSSSDHQCQGVNIVIFSTQHLCRCAVHMKYKDLVESLPNPSVHEDCSLGSHYSR